LKAITKRFIFIYIPVFAALFFLSRINYLLYHTIIEFFAIFTGLSIGLIAYATRGFNQNRIFIKFGVVYVFVAIVDFLHTLAYKGMGVFPNWTANQPTQFWIAGRLLETLGFVLILYFPKLSERTLFFLFGPLTTFLITSIWTGVFPDCFIEGFGLTEFKISMEYIIIFVLLAVLVRTLRSKDVSISTFQKPLVAAIILTIFGELSFTLYSDVCGFFNFLGHVFRLFSYMVILRGVIVNALANPVQALLFELYEEKEKLKEIAHRDSLTGLFNRAFFNEWIQDQVRKAQFQNVPLSFIMIDVDNFKQINDTYGHLTGDKVLRFVARCISDSIRSSDFAVRYGGDEFLVVLYNTSKQQAEQVASRIREKIRNSDELGVDVDISYGVAELKPGDNYLKFLQKADEEMYGMKRERKSPVVIKKKRSQRLPVLCFFRRFTAPCPRSFP